LLSFPRGISDILISNSIIAALGKKRFTSIEEKEQKNVGKHGIEKRSKYAPICLHVEKHLHEF
jgi:hypothetical protein